MRISPYTQSMLAHQRGHFDFPERIFQDIQKSFDSCAGNSTMDIKELMPEYFYLPDFLLNTNDLPLGEQVNDVKLPSWSTSALDFVKINREALESTHVSSSLHTWIGLIFGFKFSLLFLAHVLKGTNNEENQQSWPLMCFIVLSMRI